MNDSTLDLMMFFFGGGFGVCVGWLRVWECWLSVFWLRVGWGESEFGVACWLYIYIYSFCEVEC